MNKKLKIFFFLLKLFIFFILLIPTFVILHEFGHFLSCIILGIDVQAYVIGQGTPLVEFYINDILFQFNSNMWSGGYVICNATLGTLSDFILTFMGNGFLLCIGAMYLLIRRKGLALWSTIPQAFIFWSVVLALQSLSTIQPDGQTVYLYFSHFFTGTYTYNVYTFWIYEMSILLATLVWMFVTRFWPWFIKPQLQRRRANE